MDLSISRASQKRKLDNSVQGKETYTCTLSHDSMKARILKINHTGTDVPSQTSAEQSAQLRPETKLDFTMKTENIKMENLKTENIKTENGLSTASCGTLDSEIEILYDSNVTEPSESRSDDPKLVHLEDSDGELDLSMGSEAELEAAEALEELQWGRFTPDTNEPRFSIDDSIHSGRKDMYLRTSGCSATKDFINGRMYGDLNATSYKNKAEIEQLASYLSKCRQYSSSLGNLLIHRNLSEPTVEDIAVQYNHVFGLEGKTLILRPKLMVCIAHCGPSGCQSRRRCFNLHICSRYIMGECQASDCSLGHSWTTGHNQAILKMFFISTIQDKILLKLLKANMKILKVCPMYNNSGCSDDKCSYLHVCNSFITSLVKGKEIECSDNCPFNHNILNQQCLCILTGNGISLNETPKDIIKSIVSTNSISLFMCEKTENSQMEQRPSGSDTDQEKVTQTVWSHHLKGNVCINEICYQSVENKCPHEKNGCQRLHSAAHFHWQVSKDGNQWLNLRPEQVLCLERAFCDPKITTVSLPCLDPTTLDPSLISLFHVMGRASWTANFQSMMLRDLSFTFELQIRRLQTETVQNMKIKGSTYSWYFKTDSNQWQLYAGWPNSQYIEGYYQSGYKGNISFSILTYNYVLNVFHMTQTNLGTGKVREVRRRPEPHLQEVAMDALPEIWDFIPQGMLWMRVPLSPNSPEYNKVTDLVSPQNTIKFCLTKIERIQNPYLWRAHQNKLKEMNKRAGNQNAVDIRYIFHEAPPGSVDRICLENFDWRIHGSMYGNAFGQGTCFSIDPRKVTINVQPNNNNECQLFVAQVAVGSKAIGNNSMRRPPMNNQTNTLFDSTVDHVQNPTVIVKYDKQEYYPAYLVTLPIFKVMTVAATRN